MKSMLSHYEPPFALACFGDSLLYEAILGEAAAIAGVISKLAAFFYLLVFVDFNVTSKGSVFRRCFACWDYPMSALSTCSQHMMVYIDS